MAYIKISSVTLNSSQSYIEFASIPATYTDLLFKLSIRSNRTDDDEDEVLVTVDTVNGTSGRRVMHTDNNAAPVASYDTGATAGSLLYAPSVGPSNTNLSNFFSCNVYFYDYRNTSIKKSMSYESMAGRTSNHLTLAGIVHGTTSAISTVRFAPRYGTEYVQYSTVDLYGIKNS